MSDADLVPFAVVDVHYGAAGAVAACAVGARWADAEAIEERVARIDEVAAYRPGHFFERELPCLLEVLSLVRSPLRAVVVDGYVELDSQGTPGLGAHLHAALGGKVAVIGAAKTAFRGGDFATRVFRGDSRRPLFVTARGVPVEVAASLVQHMHGDVRLPTLIKRVDSLARQNVTGTHPRPA